MFQLVVTPLGSVVKIAKSVALSKISRSRASLGGDLACSCSSIVTVLFFDLLVSQALAVPRSSSAAALSRAGRAVRNEQRENALCAHDPEKQLCADRCDRDCDKRAPPVRAGNARSGIGERQCTQRTVGRTQMRTGNARSQAAM